MTPHDNQLILLVGGTGTTGRRIADRLRTRGVPFRCTSRAGSPPFDWDREDTWAANVTGPRLMTFEDAAEELAVAAGVEVAR